MLFYQFLSKEDLCQLGSTPVCSSRAAGHSVVPFESSSRHSPGSTELHPGQLAKAPGMLTGLWCDAKPCCMVLLPADF